MPGKINTCVATAAAYHGPSKARFSLSTAST
jgi:hypothetical protein